MTVTTDLGDAGIETVGRKTSISGSTDRLDRDLAFGERFTVVLDVRVTSVGVVTSGNGPILDRKLTILDLYELEGQRGRDVLAALRAERRMNDDAGTGAQVLPGFGGVTDAAGVVLTPGDLAEASGDGYASGGPPEELDDDMRAALAADEPWEGYAKDTIAGVVGHLTDGRERYLAVGAWDAVLQHVWIYEAAHKARRGILEFVAGEPVSLKRDFADDDQDVEGEDEELGLDDETDQ